MTLKATLVTLKASTAWLFTKEPKHKATSKRPGVSKERELTWVRSLESLKHGMMVEMKLLEHNSHLLSGSNSVPITTLTTPVHGTKKNPFRLKLALFGGSVDRLTTTLNWNMDNLTQSELGTKSIRIRIVIPFLKPSASQFYLPSNLHQLWLLQVLLCCQSLLVWLSENSSPTISIDEHKYEVKHEKLHDKYKYDFL